MFAEEMKLARKERAEVYHDNAMEIARKAASSASRSKRSVGPVSVISVANPIVVLLVRPQGILGRAERIG